MCERVSNYLLLFVIVHHLTPSEGRGHFPHLAIESRPHRMYFSIRVVQTGLSIGIEIESYDNSEL